MGLEVGLAGLEVGLVGPLVFEVRSSWSFQRWVHCVGDTVINPTRFLKLLE